MVDQPPSAVLVVAHALTNGSDTPQQEHSWDISLPAPPDRDLVAVTHRVDPYGHPTSVRASRNMAGSDHLGQWCVGFDPLIGVADRAFDRVADRAVDRAAWPFSPRRRTAHLAGVLELSARCTSNRPGKSAATGMRTPSTARTAMSLLRMAILHRSNGSCTCLQRFAL
jgi:hypothetical protein